MNVSEKYKLVVIESLYDCLESDLVKRFFTKILETRKLGYSKVHRSNYLPFGTEDFFGSHLAICKKVNNEWLPVCVSKVVKMSECERFNVDFPVIAQMKGHYTDMYRAHVKREINNSYKNFGECAYTGGFTINKELLDSKEEIILVREMWVGALVIYHEHRNIKAAYSFTAINVHTLDLNCKWGGGPIEFNGEYEVESTCGANQPVTPSFINVDSNNVPSSSLDIMGQCKFLWENRLDNREELREEVGESLAA